MKTPFEKFRQFLMDINCDQFSAADLEIYSEVFSHTPEKHYTFGLFCN